MLLSPLSQTVTLSRTPSPLSVTYFMDGPLVFGYLDDISLGGPTPVVAEDCMILEKECSSYSRPHPQQIKMRNHH